MKKTIIRIFTLVALVSSVALTSCNTDAEGEIYGGDATKYSFPSAKQLIEVTAANEGKVLVQVNRGVKTGEQKVELVIEMADDVKKVFAVEANPVEFKDGESTANVVLNFGSIEKLGATDKYTIKMKLPEGSVTPSGASEVEVVISRKLTWKSIGKGSYESWLFKQSWEQEVEKAEEGPIYRLPDCIEKGFPLVFTLSEDGQKCVEYADQVTGYVDKANGMVSVHYNAEQGMKREGNKLSFPLKYFVKAGSFGEGNDILTMPE